MPVILILGLAAAYAASAQESSDKDAKADDKPVAVFLKPADAKEDPWGATVQTVRKHYWVVTLPMRAVQSGQKNEQGAQLPPHRVLINTLRSRKAAGCTLFAFGDDARTALSAAAAAPEMIKAMVLVDMTPPPETSTTEGDEALSAWKSTLSKVGMPVLAVFHSDLMLGVGSAGQYARATGLDAVEQVRIRRVEGQAPILKSSEATVNTKIAAFLEDVRGGKEIAAETRQKTPSGLQYVDQIIGDGEPPRPGQTIAARLRFRTKDGRDISPPGAMNITWRFPFDHSLTDGIFEALSTMKPGGRRKAYIPVRLLKRQSPTTQRTPVDAPLDAQDDTMTVDIFLSSVSDEASPPPRPRWNRSLEKDVGGGVRIVDLKEGSGTAATDDSLVTFASNLWSASGHLSRYRSVDNPDRGALKDLGNTQTGNVTAACWLPGIRGMKPGGERLIVCAAKAAFGEKILPSMSPDEEIVFHVRLIEARPIPAPPHLPAVADDQYVSINAKLKYRDLRTGEGPSPREDSAVVMHYTMWREGGKILADSTVMRDRPFEQLFKALAGPFKQCLPTMKTGGVRLIKAQDPFGPGKHGLSPGEWVIYQVELLEIITPDEFMKRTRPDAGRPLEMDEETARRILGSG